MATAQPDFKNQFAIKFLEFRLTGLQAYGNSLNQQAKLSAKNDTMTAYHKYIEKEIVRNNKKIEDVKVKMK